MKVKKAEKTKKSLDESKIDKDMFDKLLKMGFKLGTIKQVLIKLDVHSIDAAIE